MEALKDIFPRIESLSLVESEEAGREKHKEKTFRALEDKLKKDFFGLFIELFCQQPLCLKEFIEDLEKRIILNTLSKVGGSQKKAAKALGMKYTTLNEKVKRYNIQFQKSPIYSPWYVERPKEVHRPSPGSLP